MKRVNGKTRAQELYAYMKELRASITAGNLAEHAGIGYKTAFSRLRDAEADGWLRSHVVLMPYRRIRFYSLCGKPKADGRGKARGAVKARTHIGALPSISRVWPSPVAVSLGRRG